MSVDRTLIHCETRTTSLILGARPHEQLQMMHFGARLADPRDLVSAEPVGPALSVYGQTCRIEPGLRVTHADGNLTTTLHYLSVEECPSAKGITHQVVTLQDPAYPLIVRTRYRSYYEEDILEQCVEVVNTGKSPVTLHACASFYLPMKSVDFHLTHFNSGWSQEMQIEEVRLPEGMTILDSRHGTMGTISKNPSFMLSPNAPAQEECGPVIAGALRWPGAWRMVFQRELPHVLHISCGVNPFASSLVLASGETFSSPPMLVTYSDAGKGCASRRLHRWARRYGVRHGATPRPVIQNSWEGLYFGFDEKKILTLMDSAAKMGVETFVLDDGWFGAKYPRNDDRNGLGDWQANRVKLPGGLAFLAAEARKRSMKFGIWVEPEMVNPLSELYEQHPDWALRLPNREPALHRNQMVLDLGNPQVQDFVFGVLDSVLKDGYVSYVKWDCNSPINNPGSNFLDPARQEEVWIRYAQGLDAVLQRVRTAYPDVMLQACSSGGGRMDYGSLPYFDEFWTSDNTDARERVFMQWGCGHIFPAIAMAAHVSPSPNDFTGRVTPIKFRVDVAMSGRFGIELPPDRMTEEDVEFAKRAVVEYKKIRDIVQLGDLYRLVSPYACGMAALMYVSADRTRAVLFAYMIRKTIQQQFPPVRPQGLDATARYRVEEISLPADVKDRAPTTASGEYLMHVGMPVSYGRAGALDIALPRELYSAVFVFTRE